MIGSEHSRPWNDLPIEERKRLMPYMIQSQILHLQQGMRVAAEAHARYLREMNDWIANLERRLADELKGTK